MISDRLSLSSRQAATSVTQTFQSELSSLKSQLQLAAARRVWCLLQSAVRHERGGWWAIEKKASDFLTAMRVEVLVCYHNTSDTWTGLRVRWARAVDPPHCPGDASA